MDTQFHTEKRVFFLKKKPLIKVLAILLFFTIDSYFLKNRDLNDPVEHYEFLVSFYFLSGLSLLASLLLFSTFLRFSRPRLEFNQEGLLWVGVLKSRFFRWEDTTRAVERSHNAGRWPATYVVRYLKFSLNEQRLGARDRARKKIDWLIQTDVLEDSPALVGLFNQYRDARFNEIARHDPTLSIKDKELLPRAKPFLPWPLVIVALLGPILIMALAYFVLIAPK
ncbi:hypothetical protein [uncultured Cohaesibacter sp.]|uniref:hypothetical protein n=1 Tax=uncultured Cohaesibacter sp. TaxID=1002546 RepID=UPI0029C83938|nr:hypothetical protein [uncultured Cohaesibacter sp.]